MSVPQPTVRFLRIDGVDHDPEAQGAFAADRGFAYGDGVFRTLRLRGGRIAGWARHARKLVADCAAIGLAAPDGARIERDLADLGAAWPECVARITVTAGSGPRGYRRAEHTPLRIMVQAAAPPDWPERFAAEGVRMHRCALRLAWQPALAGVKHLNRLEQVLARREWDDPEVPEGLTFDGDGLAVCGTMSNLFVVEGDVLVTPELTRCGVAGVQRERVIEWARRSGRACVVEAVPAARLGAASALLLSNSVIGVWWVNRFDGRDYQRPRWFDELQHALLDERL
jgi:4-amino-4-deoxychorismate lyase